MAEPREQRLQMRQRGAATRKIQEIDFGLSFAAPAAPSTTKTPAGSRRQSRKTPQRSLPKSKSTRKSSVTSSTRRSNTPSVVHGENSKRRGEFDIPIDEDHEQRPRAGPVGGGIKRRRLNEQEEKPDPLLVSTPSNRASSSLNSLLERKSPQKAAASPSQAADSRLSDEDKENASTEAPRGRPPANSSSDKLQAQTRKRKRKSIGQQRPKRRSVESVQEELETQGLPRAETPQEVRDASPPEKKKQKKKRKPIGQQRPKRRSLETVVESAETRELPQVATEAEVPQGSPPAEKKVRRKRKSIAQRHSPESAQRRRDPAAPEHSPVAEPVARPTSRSADVEAGPSLSEPRQKSPHTAPVEPKASRKRRRDPDESVDGEPDQARPALKNSIPILVHRLSGTAALLQNDDDEDELHSRQEKFPKRGGVNAADVLSQIWRDTTRQAVDSIKDKFQKESRKAHQEELKRKWKAIFSFGNELGDRLFDLSESLDYNFSLSTRLKRAVKVKTSLREEFLRIGQEREEVALQTDEVRRKHEESSKIAEEYDELNNSLHDLDLALERERREKTQGGLEFLLRTVTNDVSSLSDDGGLLNQVRDFNALLEKSALSLEARTKG